MLGHWSANGPLADQHSRQLLCSSDDLRTERPLVGQDPLVASSPKGEATERHGLCRQGTAECRLQDRATEPGAARPRPWTEVRSGLLTALNCLNCSVSVIVQELEQDRAWSPKENHYPQGHRQNRWHNQCRRQEPVADDAADPKGAAKGWTHLHSAIWRRCQPWGPYLRGSHEEVPSPP